MQDALDELDSRYGGIERYLREHAGVDPDALLTLRRNACSTDASAGRHAAAAVRLGKRAARVRQPGGRTVVSWHKH